jgi:trk system potassium uptake protein TrkH
MKLFQPAFKIAAFLMLFWGSAMLLPILVSSGDWPGIRGHLLSALTCYGLALLLYFAGRGEIRHVQARTLFMVTAFNWLLLCVTGTLPWLYSGLDISFTDSLFETVAGVTTTGSSIFANFDGVARGLLLWRALTQFIGGIGIIIVAVAILPSLKIGGMRLFRSESSEWTHLEKGRIGRVATHILVVYTLINVACFIAYKLFGMSWFDAITHAMTTVSTGGFSTHADSFAHFNDSHLQFIASIFMFLGASPFLLVVLSIEHRTPLLMKDSQVRLLLKLILLNTLLISAWRYSQNPDPGLLRILESSAFNVISILTTTGYASEDYTLWGSLPVMILCFLTFSGGCSGSTSGGIKLFRFQLLGIFMKEQISTALHPGLSYARNYNERPVREDVLVGSLAFLFFVIISWSVCSCLLAATGLDPVTSTSGALTALMNVGPGFGATIGPVGNFSTLPDTAKYVLAAAMLLGRLEFLALIIIFTREYWKW